MYKPLIEIFPQIALAALTDIRPRLEPQTLRKGKSSHSQRQRAHMDIRRPWTKEHFTFHHAHLVSEHGCFLLGQKHTLVQYQRRCSIYPKWKPLGQIMEVEVSRLQ